MIYYDKNGTKVNYSCVEKGFNKGTQGSIFRIASDDFICLKQYFDDDNNKSIFDDCNQRFTQYMIDYFKGEFNNPNFCKLYDLLYDENITNVIAYTMKYYEECIENILFLPTEYIVDNFSILYDAVEQLTKDCIRVVDLSSSNILNTANGLVVIDFDKYRRDELTENNTLSYINKSALLYAFKGIFEKALMKSGINVKDNIEAKKLIENLFSFGTTPLVLKCRMRKCTKPIDLF